MTKASRWPGSRFRRAASTSAALLALLAGAAGAEPLRLDFPVACTPDADCWIQNYVDLDPGPGVLDYACGAMTYDGHRGVDIRLSHRGRVAEGVKVLAAAPGRVLRVRDGVADIGGASPECGNGVRVDHGEGWVSAYCHLRRGSIRVGPGEKVGAGTPMGEVGLSGLTEFPHLHFQLEKDGRVVDPFRGPDAAPGCAPTAPSIWKKTLPYMGLRFFNHGFADAAPEQARAQAGDYAELVMVREAPGLVFWFELAGVLPGDVVAATLRDPDGTVIARVEETVSRTQAAVFRFIGKRRTEAGWPAGIYVGEASARRAAPLPIVKILRREIEVP